MTKRFKFQPKPVSKAAGMLVALLAASTSLQAGSGYVDATASDGVTTFRLPTYFAYSPSGPRTTPVLEDEGPEGLAAVDGRPANHTGTALRKFVDPLPLPGAANAKLMANGTTSKYLPVAVATKWKNPQGVVTGDDYYEIAVVEFTDRFHSDLKKETVLRGYVQIDHEASNGRAALAGSLSYPLTYPDGRPIMIKATDANGKLTGGPDVQALSVDKPRFLGPVIAATKGVPTRVKFINLLPAGRVQYNGDGTVLQRNGDLFLPTDPSIMGAGFGPDGMTMYTQNRVNVHLHGGDTPWISDGTPHQWITPAEEANPASPTGSLAAEFAADPLRDPALLPEFLRGASAQNVPDMNDPGVGAWTLYFPNGQSARMLWYHDHAVGATRLNVYAGIASGYLLTDATEQAMITDGVLPPAERTLPLVLQDRTFVPDDISLQDGLWSAEHWGKPGDSWFPHVYEPVQDPSQLENTNAVGRWHYGPYFWPVFPALYPLPSGAYGDVTTTPEAWMDTAIVNGVAYPTVEVDPTTYRLRILNASNDRMMTFNLHVATTSATLSDGTVVTSPLGDTEIDMVPATAPLPEIACAAGVLRPAPVLVAGVQKLDAQGKPVFCQPELWPTDNRVGGMPNPNSVGPALHQIATEGGWLPAVASIEPNPMTYLLDKGRINVFNANTPSLFMGPAERADVVVDFSQYAGKTLIVYNDSGAPIPAGDPRNDVFTGVGDQSGAGGAEDTKPGYGPNTRTYMQIKVKPLPVGAAAPVPYETDPNGLSNLQARVSAAFLADQERPVVAQPAYSGFEASWAQLTQDQSYARIQTGSLKEPVFKYTPGTPSSSINSVRLLSQGSGYTTAPLVTISAPAAADGRAATAKATLTIDQITLTSSGSGFVVAPNVTIVGGGGNGAVAEAVLGAHAVQITAGGTGYLAAPTVTFTAPPVGGRRATGVATINATGQVTGVTITDSGTGYIATPMVSFTPVSGGTGARATSTSKVTEARLKPADPQNPASAGGGGFLSFDPAALVNPFNINFVGGGGRAGVPVVQPAATVTGKVFDITLDYAGRGYTAAEVPTITVGASQTGAAATAESDMATGVAAGSNLVKTKAIHELFDATYGRLNSILAVELPFTSALTQTTIPLAYVDAPTEQFSEGETQIWKITHNGVDSHPVHFHLLNVQLINRVDWAGIIMPPNKNELGWKETVKMNPLEDVIVAVRAKTPPLPGFGVPLSVRAMDPAQPLGSPFGFTQVDPITGTPKTVTNEVMNYGWEYVWHCHILGHEENDFMRPVVFNAREGAPLASTGLQANLVGNTVSLSWLDATPAASGAGSAAAASAASEVGFRVQRGPSGLGVFEDLATDLRNIVGLPGAVNTMANATTFTDDVSALIAAGGGAATLPAAPSAPIPSGIAFTSVTVSWTQPAPGAGQVQATGFDVMREELDAAGAPLVPAVVTKLNAAVLPAATLSFVDATAVTGSKYQYSVVAHGTGANSVDYRVVSVNVVGETPSAVTTVSLGTSNSTATSAASAATTPMLAPTRLGTTYAVSATPNAYDVAFTWNAPALDASYMVRSRMGTTANNGAWSAWANQPATSFTATVPALQYLTVEVQAVSADNVTSATLSSGAMQVATPLAPNGLAFTAAATTVGSLTLNWNARANAASYVVEYATNSTFTANLVTVNDVATNSYVANGLNPNTRYYFRVKAVNPVGTSGVSTRANAWTLANPVVLAPGVTANTIGTSVGLNWVAPAGGAYRYIVQRSVDGGASWTTAATVNGNVNASVLALTTGAPTGLLGVTDYQFRVIAHNGAMVATLPSAPRALTTALAAPTVVTAANGVLGGLVTAGLNFTGNNGPRARYEIRYRNQSPATSPFSGNMTVVPGEQVNVGGAARTLVMQVRSTWTDNAGVNQYRQVNGLVNTGVWVATPTTNVSAR